MRYKYIVALVTVAGVGLGAGTTLLERPLHADADGSPANAAGPTRAYFYRVGDLAELKAGASEVVVADVVSVSEGPTYAARSDNPKHPSVKLPTRDVKLRVTERVRGTGIPTDAVLTHFLGPNGRAIEGDIPPPRQGERYLLFAKKSEVLKDRWVTPSLDGRIRIVQGSQLKSALSGGISNEVEAMGLDKLKGFAK